MNFCYFEQRYRKIRVIFCWKCQKSFIDNPLSICIHIKFNSEILLFKNKMCCRVGGNSYQGVPGGRIRRMVPGMFVHVCLKFVVQQMN